MARKERRKHKRYKITCTVYYNEYQPLLKRDNMFKAELLNISEEGALLECDEEVALEELVSLEMNIIGWQHFYEKKYKGMTEIGKSDCLRVSATVKRVQKSANNKYRVGIYFSNIKAQDKEVLREYISKRVIFEL